MQISGLVISGVTMGDQFAPSGATGGSISILALGNSAYQVHTFSAGTSTFTLDRTRTVEYLICGGGGGGGTGTHSPDERGFPGYGGSVSTGSASLSAGNYTVVVGSGGAGGINTPLNPSNDRLYGLNGGDSSFNSVSGSGGTGGITTYTPTPPTPPNTSVASSITGTSVSYGLPGAVTTPSQVGTSYAYPPGHGGDGGGLGNFSGGSGSTGVVVIRYLLP
jgi:hypothetical protein